MKLLIVFVLALANAVPTTHGQGRIFNGKNATLGQFRYQARLDLEDGKGTVTSCGGSLISPNYILTAAHCLKDKVLGTVYLGAIKRFDAEVYHDVSIHDFTVHANFNRLTMANDIALIKIPTTSYSKNIRPVILPKLTETEKFTNEHVIVAGWGRKGKSETTTSTEELQWTRLTVLSNRDCRMEHFYNPYIKSSNLCANAPESRTCSGDSGGPVVLENTEKQVAIVSWGDSSGCEAGFPSVFLRLTSFLQWIKDNSGVAYEI